MKLKKKPAGGPIIAVKKNTISLLNKGINNGKISFNIRGHSLLILARSPKNLSNCETPIVNANKLFPSLPNDTKSYTPYLLLNINTKTIIIRYPRK